MAIRAGYPRAHQFAGWRERVEKLGFAEMGDTLEVPDLSPIRKAIYEKLQGPESLIGIKKGCESELAA
jgi:hypothetical protein